MYKTYITNKIQKVDAKLLILPISNKSTHFLFTTHISKKKISSLPVMPKFRRLIPHLIWRGPHTMKVSYYLWKFKMCNYATKLKKNLQYSVNWSSLELLPFLDVSSSQFKKLFLTNKKRKLFQDFQEAKFSENLFAPTFFVVRIYLSKLNGKKRNHNVEVYPFYKLKTLMYWNRS